MTDVETIETPSTAQDVEQAKTLTSLSEARKILGVNEEYSEEEVFKNFEDLFMKEIKNKETKNLKNLIDSKNICIRPKIEDQIREKGRFDVVVPFDKICNDCHGTGELYKFFRTTDEVECRICEGTGKVLVKCRSCNGTGRFVKEQKGLKINVLCKTCKADEEKKIDGVYHVELKCKKCRGKGQIRKIILDDKIKSTTSCKTCKGRGFEMPKKEVKPSNPVISASLGEEIKNKIVEPEEVEIKDESVETTEE